MGDMDDFDKIKNLLGNAKYYYIICIGMDSKYSYINANYAEKFNHVDRDFVGKPFHITMHPDDIAACAAGGQKCLSNKGLLVPVTIRKHDGAGGYIITQWEFKGMFDGNGNPEGVFCLGYDITEFIDEIAQKDNLLNDIAFSQSHVIRKPVANIIGAVNALKDAGLPPEAQEMLDILYENTVQLDSIIRKIANDIYHTGV